MNTSYFQKNLKLKHIFLLSGISILPVYLFSSGGMQLSHILLTVYFILFFTVNKISSLTPIEILLLSLSLFIFYRELVSCILNGNTTALLNSFYLLFNTCLVLTIYRELQDKIGLRILKAGILFSAIIAVGGVLIIGYHISVAEDMHRAVGTFNNPNQLGYYAVCLISLSALLKTLKKITSISFVFLTISALFLSIVSLSKAATIAILFSIIWSGITRNKNIRRAFIILLLLIIPSTTYYLRESDSGKNFLIYNRLTSIGTDNDDNLEARGYSVIFEMSPLESIIGLGAQKVQTIVGHEVHSTIFSYFANYGLLGGTCFLFILGIWISKVINRTTSLDAIGIISPSLLYGITHNGSRFTIFWVLIAASLALRTYHSKKTPSYKKLDTQ